MQSFTTRCRAGPVSLLTQHDGWPGPKMVPGTRSLAAACVLNSMSWLRGGWSDVRSLFPDQKQNLDVCRVQDWLYHMAD